ncbi:MAG: sugar phosphate isomerase/epimerase family protein [bacterium]
MARLLQPHEAHAARLFKSFPAKIKSGAPRLALSWSNWGFGREPLSRSLQRLARAKIGFVELHGNHYTPDLGYKVSEVTRLLSETGVKAAGICGMFSVENDLSSTSAVSRQRAIDYIRRELDFGRELGVKYMLVVPGAVGRNIPYDAYEFERSVETLRMVADAFVQAEIRAAIEPIRSDEVSFCHSCADALRYIKAVDHPGVRHINGDLYHMLHHEDNPAKALLTYGPWLTNLHMADTNRRTLGSGVYNFDAVIAALYLAGYNNDDCFCTCEPLGPGGNVYRSMHGSTPAAELDALVLESADYWRTRENELRAQIQK